MAIALHRRTGTAYDDDTPPEIGRAVLTARAVLAASATAVGPFCLAAAITAVAMVWPAPARADDGSGLLSDFGIGNNGPVSTAIGQLASGLCPFLAQPGGTATGDAVSSSQVAAQVLGGASVQDISPQCATLVTSLANGDIAALINAPSMFGQSPAATTTPLSIPGLTSSTPLTNPLAVPGV
jgi:hypothetical protein